MGWFDGFPFTSKKERERRRRNFEKRVAPFGVELQREKCRETLQELFPNVDDIGVVFAFFDAKEAYMKAWEEKEEEDGGGDAADSSAKALIRLRKQRWMNKRNEAIMLRFIEMESAITSLDEYPTAADVYASLDGK